MDNITDTEMHDYDTFQTHDEEDPSHARLRKSLEAFPADHHSHPQTLEQTYPAGTESVSQSQPQISPQDTPQVPPPLNLGLKSSELFLEDLDAAHPNKVISAYHDPQHSWKYQGDRVYTGEAMVFAPRIPPGATTAPIFQERVVLSDGDPFPDQWEGSLYPVDPAVQHEAQRNVTSNLGPALEAQAEDWSRAAQEANDRTLAEVSVPWINSLGPDLGPLSPTYEELTYGGLFSRPQQISAPDITVQDFSNATGPSSPRVLHQAPAQNNAMPVLNSPTQTNHGSYLQTVDGRLWHSSGGEGPSSSAATPVFSPDTYAESYAESDPSPPTSPPSPYGTSPYRPSGLRNEITPPTSPVASNQSTYSPGSAEEPIGEESEESDEEFIPGWTREQIFSFWHWKMKKKRSLTIIARQFPGETEESLRRVWPLVRDEGKRLWDSGMRPKRQS